QQGVASGKLLENGIVDRVIAELPDATDEARAFCARMGDAISQELATLQLQRAPHRRSRRFERYRKIGA
nr:acetyl-CoA carboxyl transferase [Leucobacter sp.]